MRSQEDNLYIFVIDTDSYAGNFERQLTAYCTGQIGDCGVGDDIAEKVPQDIKNLFDDAVAMVPDEQGCARPTSIYATPGFFNDGLGNEYPDEEWGKQHVIDKYLEAAKDYDEQWGTEPRRFPAYNSVAIFFFNEPTDEMVDILTIRAKEFTELIIKKSRRWLDHSKVKITGFRLVKEETMVHQLKNWKV